MKLLRKLFGLDRPAAPATRAPRDRELDLKGLERLLKYTFKDPALARIAMTHRSYLHASPGRSGDSNERMEFLGDSVVGLAVNEYLVILVLERDFDRLPIQPVLADEARLLRSRCPS